MLTVPVLLPVLLQLVQASLAATTVEHVAETGATHKAGGDNTQAVMGHDGGDFFLDWRVHGNAEVGIIYDGWCDGTAIAQVWVPRWQV